MIAVPLRLTSHRLLRAHNGLAAAAGLATLMLGCYIVYRIGAGAGIGSRRHGRRERRPAR